MANTDDKKSRSKPKARTPTAKGATARATRAPARKTASAASPAPVQPAREAPEVLVNAVKPDEKLADGGLVERAVDSLEKSLKAAMPAAVAVNSKLVDIAQTNMNAGMELVRDLAGARTPLEAMQLGITYWHANMGVFQAQAQELRVLSARFVTTASEPIRDHIRRA